MRTLAETVRDWLAEADLKHEWAEDGQSVSLRFSGAAFSPRVVIDWNEEARWFRGLMDYEVQVPSARTHAVAVACMQIMAQWVNHAVQLNVESGRVGAFTLASYPGVEPGAAELDALLAQLLQPADAIHATLVGVVSGLVEARGAAAAAISTYRTLNDLDAPDDAGIDDDEEDDDDEADDDAEPWKRGAR